MKYALSRGRVPHERRHEDLADGSDRASREVQDGQQYCLCPLRKTTDLSRHRLGVGPYPRPPLSSSNSISASRIRP